MFEGEIYSIGISEIWTAAHINQVPIKLGGNDVTFNWSR